MEIFWEQSNWEASDKHLSALSEMPFRRDFPFMPEKDGLYIIRGPRQVGKTCWLKTILSHHTPQHKCFYLSCEELTHFRELSELLKSIKQYDVVLLDEVNFVDGWDRAVKHAIDSGYPKLLVVTGSHTHDLKKGADRMPGRFGSGGEFCLLPMDFKEFCQARITAGWSSDDRVEELKAYFCIGGFPYAVAESGKLNTTPISSMNTYWRWIAGDFVRLGKSERVLTNILAQLAISMQSSISYNNLAKKSGLGSHNTLIDYLDLLESCFALRTLHAVDINTGAYRTRKNRKFYFTDPLLYHLSIELSGMSLPNDQESQLAEMVANEHLARRYKRFGSHSNQNGEIDFILPSQWGLEVKWSPVANNLSKTYLNLTLPHKIVWTQRNFLDEWPQGGEIV